jgi:nucleolar protein 15
MHSRRVRGCLAAGFFSQFGKVTKVRVSRNKKTGKPKHYAFLEFQHSDVAAIAAEAMDGYMMFTQKLTVRVLPSEVRQSITLGALRPNAAEHSRTTWQLWYLQPIFFMCFNGAALQDVHPDLWKGANRKFDKIPWRKIEVERHNAERTPEQQVCKREALHPVQLAVGLSTMSEPSS